ncbi:MAG: hypothetical protein JST16_03550 [Bdellovibrionales bacterium]|nr:hypothetical protein [Bdellovibrionales bacterium]
MKPQSHHVLIFSALALLGACSSHPPSPENQEDKVLSRANDLKERPSWIDETEPFKIENAQAVSLGLTTIPGDHRVDAAYRIAENNAKAAIASQIESKLSFVFQNAEEGTSGDSSQARFIGAEASEMLTSSIKPGRRYWEKVATTTDSGARITKYKVFVTVTMAESDLKEAVRRAIAKREGGGQLSANFSKKVDEHWDKFVNAAPAPAKE